MGIFDEIQIGLSHDNKGFHFFSWEPVWINFENYSYK